MELAYTLILSFIYMVIWSGTRPDLVAQCLCAGLHSQRIRVNSQVGTYFQCVFNSLLSILMLNYFILVKWNLQNDQNDNSLTFDIKICMKAMDVGLNLALWKHN